MKRYLAMLLAACLCVFSAAGLAEEEVTIFALPDEDFASLSATFYQDAFSGDMSTVELSQGQTLMFDPRPVQCLLPNLLLTLEGMEAVSADAQSLAEMFGEIVGVAMALQEKFPDVFLFNTELADAHEDHGIQYAIAEPAIWLSNSTLSSLFVPLYLYREDTGELIEDPYLMQVAISVQDSVAQYVVYNNPDYVLAYLAYVSISSEGSEVQKNLVQWYLDNYGTDEERSQAAALQEVEVGGEEAEDILEAEIPSVGPPQADNAIGFVTVQVSSANVRNVPKEDARIVGYAQSGNSYPVLSIDKGSGWYEIVLADGQEGYISDKLVKYNPN